MSRTAALLIPIGSLALLVMIVAGCTELADPLNRQGSSASGNCLVCHTDQAILQANVEPDTSGVPEPEGEG
jgi:hypothetical protein